jgi:cyclophilin family peptidyl-prolyl cis-trans isomerase
MTMSSKITILLVIILFIGGITYFKFMNNDQQPIDDNIDPLKEVASDVIFKTNFGDIGIKLFLDKAPKTTENFKKLVSEGFYDGVKFHRIVEGFMLQGGDPLTKDDSQQNLWGTGGPGYSFEDEIYSGNSNAIATIAMANAGPNTNGSQFFINVADNNFLDQKHTVFGKIVSGLDVVQQIGDSETQMSPSGEKSLPVNSVVIESAILAN